MKFLSYILTFIFCNISHIHADQYNVYELERKYVESNCLSTLITLNHDREYSGEFKETESNEDDLLSSGSIIFYIKKSNMVLKYSSKANFDKIYNNYNISEDYDEPFLANGGLYLFSNEQKQKYYACFIEWDIKVLRRNKTVYPRVALIPLSNIKDSVFIATDCEVIFSGRALGIRSWFPFNISFFE